MKFAILILLSCFFVSCANDHLAPSAPASFAYSGGGELDGSRSGQLGGIRSGQKAKIKSVGRKLIKNGSMTLESVDVKQAAEGAEKILKEYGGFVENKTEGDDVTIAGRIPVEKLVVSMDGIGKLGNVTRRRVHVRDVTVEYIDVDAKIRNLRVLRERLQKLYKKAGKVDEILQIEKELSRVQAELDSLQGRMKAMKKNIAYSQLSISIQKKRVPGPLGAVGKGMSWIGRKLWVLN